MSEYKISVNHSKLQTRLQWSFYALCLVAVWLWPVFNDWQWSVQLLLSLPLLWSLYYTRYTEQADFDFILSDTGEVYFYHNNGESYPYRLAATSVVSDWFCFVILTPSGLAMHKIKKCWVFKDAVDEQSYRRLCRTIYRVRREAN